MENFRKQFMNKIEDAETKSTSSGDDSNANSECEFQQKIDEKVNEEIKKVEEEHSKQLEIELEKLTHLQKQYSELGKTTTLNIKENDKLNSEIERKKGDIRALQKNNGLLRSKVDKLTQDCANKDRKINEHTDKIKNLEKSNTNLANDVDAKNTHLQKLTETNQVQDALIQSLKLELENKEKDLAKEVKEAKTEKRKLDGKKITNLLFCWQFVYNYLHYSIHEFSQFPLHQLVFLPLFESVIIHWYRKNRNAIKNSSQIILRNEGTTRH